jgi:hypothetical protein
MVTEADLELSDGRTLHFYDTGGDHRLAVFWHHGTPNVGTPPEPLFPAAGRLYPDDGHISVLNYGTAALDWIAEVRRPAG